MSLILAVLSDCVQVDVMLQVDPGVYYLVLFVSMA